MKNIYMKISLAFCAILMFAYTATSQTISVPIVSTETDVDNGWDAEECTVQHGSDAVGDQDISSSDLELGFDNGVDDVGLIFQDVQIPPGATITNAYVQFTVDEVEAGITDVAMTMYVYGAKEANAAGPFSETNTVTSHPLTTANATWSPDPSVNVEDAGATEQTPDISSIITEIIGLEGWASGNNLMIVINGDVAQTEDHHRCMEAAPSDGTAAPVLNVTFSEGPTSVDPVRDRISSVYPNPAEGKIFIDNPSSGNFSYRIYTINGQIVAENRVDGFAKLPDGGLYDSKYDGMLEGDIWKLLYEEQEEGGAGGDTGEGAGHTPVPDALDRRDHP